MEAADSLLGEADVVGILPGVVAEVNILAVEGIVGIGWGMPEESAYEVVSWRAGEVPEADAD